MDTLALSTSPSLQDSALERLIQHYQAMVKIRAFELAAEGLSRSGRIRGMIHSAVGQEAVAVGVCANLGDNDPITSTHRNHHHALAKGVDAEAMMAELLGRSTGICAGKGGSMHIADFCVGMIGANGVVGAGVAIACGAAQGLRLRGVEVAATAFFGDGGMNRGQCLEAFNYAAVYNLPVLLVCEDNEWAATTRSSTVTAGTTPVSKAAALGVPGLSVDGNDVEAVDAAATQLLQEIRAGGGPRLLHCKTYRLHGHTAVDKTAYRDPSEVEPHRAKDPLLKCLPRLSDLGLPNSEIAAVRNSAEEEIHRAVEGALAGPLPAMAEAFMDIQDSGAPVAP